MSIPLVQNNDKDAINTSIIAIKRNIERINMLLGLNNNSEDIDTSEFVKKSEITDEVAIDNMQSVTSNAVAEACPKKTDFNREIYLGENTSNGTITLTKPLSNYNLIRVQALFATSLYGYRTVETYVPVWELKKRNATNNALLVCGCTGGGASGSVMFYYVDDTHIATFNRETTSSWNGTVYCTFYAII